MNAQDRSIRGGIRLAELLASLSLAIDLGVGMPSEWMLKSALVAVRLARAAGYDEMTQRAAYYLGLIRMVGCTSTSAVDAALFGDELAVGELATADFADPRTLATFGRLVGHGQPPMVRAAMLARMMFAMGSGHFIDNHRRHCEGAAILAGRMGLDAEVQASLQHVYERWDGKGTPNKVAGEALRPAARVVHVAHLVGHYHTVAGTEAAIEVANERAGAALDPSLVKVFAGAAGEILAPVEGPMFDAVVAAEPGPSRMLDQENLVPRSRPWPTLPIRRFRKRSDIPGALRRSPMRPAGSAACRRLTSTGCVAQD